MKISEIAWTHPCGCGDTPHPRAEIQYARGWLRVKDMGDGTYEVQKFGLDKMRDGEQVLLTHAELSALIA